MMRIIIMDDGMMEIGIITMKILKHKIKDIIHSSMELMKKKQHKPIEKYNNNNNNNNNNIKI